MDESIKEIISQLLKRKNIAITGHSNPDGDSLGAMQAFASFLRRMGLRVSIHQKDEIPENLSFLGTGIKKEEPPIFEKDAIIFMECFLPERSGYNLKNFNGVLTVNIDHHPDNKIWADLNLVDEGVSSVCEIIYKFFEISNLPLQKNEANAILTGIYTDTGMFAQKNTTGESLRISSKLIECGADLSKIYERVYGSNKPEKIKLLSETLRTIEVTSNIAFMYTDMEMFEKTGSKYEDSKDFINFARDIKGVNVACYFREISPNRIHINFRSRKKDLLPFVKKLGGGGHRLACGVTLEGNFKQIFKKIKEDLLKFLGKK
ncbi:MAG: bifunctional oligoribonuclease/PAP phosphatase NrnA [Elusimicrobia bacterium]|nr:bifunctional oligoribonuclease/PAP phosphatase NrnA [Elusimicrobiota bacterium]